MQITEVRIHLLPENNGKLRALAAVTLNDAFVIRDLRIYQGEKGVFVAMPSRKTAAGEYQEIAFPITAEMRTLLQEAVLKQYTQELEHHNPAS